MSRISKEFQKKKKLFLGYLTAGDGDSLENFRTLLKGGVDLLEIGIPFSDPVADGPVIQRAMVRSLAAKSNVKTALELVATLRKESEAPIVLFTYFNPIQKDLFGFLKEAKGAGADGILVVDLPPEEAGEYQALCLELRLDPVFVVSPSTPPDRIARIAKMGRGFIYYACRKGTTGARKGLPEDLEEKIGQIRKRAQLPVAVGFGISDPQTAKKILEAADAFVVGSYFVEEPKRVYDFRT
jgi:tryptophan synthase alpha chain